MDKILTFKQKLYILHDKIIHPNIIKDILELSFIVSSTLCLLFFPMLIIILLFINIDIINKILLSIIFIKIETLIGISLLKYLRNL